MKKNGPQKGCTVNFNERFEALKRVPEFVDEVGAIGEVKEGRDSIEIMFSDEYFLIKKMEESFKKKWDIKFVVDQREMTVEDIRDAAAFSKRPGVKSIPFEEAENCIAYLRDGRYAKLLVDVLADKKQTLKAISDLIEDYRNITSLRKVKKTSRKKPENHDYWDVYDRVREKINQKKITINKALSGVVEDLYGKSGGSAGMEKVGNAYRKAESLIKQEEKNAARKRSKQKK